MVYDLSKLVEPVMTAGVLAIGAFIAKFLRDISGELHGIKTAMAVTQTTVKQHEVELHDHSNRIRVLESHPPKR